MNLDDGTTEEKLETKLRQKRKRDARSFGLTTETEYDDDHVGTSTSNASFKSRKLNPTDEDESSEEDEMEEFLRKQRSNLEEDDEEEEDRYVPFDSLNMVAHPDCFGCIHMNKTVLAEPEKNKKVIELYRAYNENILHMTTDGLTNLLHALYYKHIYPDTQQEWTKKQIKEHIQKHTISPTSELVEQYNQLRNIKNVLIDCTFTKNKAGVIKPNVQYINLYEKMAKSIRSVLLLNTRRSEMLGYIPTLEGN